MTKTRDAPQDAGTIPMFMSCLIMSRVILIHAWRGMAWPSDPSHGMSMDAAWTKFGPRSLGLGHAVVMRNGMALFWKYFVKTRS